MRSFNGLLSCANSVTFFLLAFMRKWTSHIFCFLIKMIRYCLPFSPTYYITSPILSLSFIYVHTNTQTLSIILSLLHTIIRLHLFLYILFLHFISRGTTNNNNNKLTHVLPLKSVYSKTFLPLSLYYFSDQLSFILLFMKTRCSLYHAKGKEMK